MAGLRVIPERGVVAEHADNNLKFRRLPEYPVVDQLVIGVVEGYAAFVFGQVPSAVVARNEDVCHTVPCLPVSVGGMRVPDIDTRFSFEPLCVYQGFLKIAPL